MVGSPGRISTLSEMMFSYLDEKPLVLKSRSTHNDIYYCTSMKSKLILNSISQYIQYNSCVQFFKSLLQMLCSDVALLKSPPGMLLPVCFCYLVMQIIALWRQQKASVYCSGAVLSFPSQLSHTSCPTLNYYCTCLGGPDLIGTTHYMRILTISVLICPLRDSGVVLPWQLRRGQFCSSIVKHLFSFFNNLKENVFLLFLHTNDNLQTS